MDHSRIYIALLLATLLVAACSTATPTPTGDDRQTFDRVESAHERAKDNPGNAPAAVAYADIVIRAWRTGAFVRCAKAKKSDGDDCSADPDTHMERASTLLDKAAKAQPDDAPTLIAKKGLMYCAARRTDVCLKELRRSMNRQPNVLAGTGLATWYGNHQKYRRVRDVCRRTLPHLEGDRTRYQFMRVCIQKSGADSIREGLAWAPKEDREFFLRQREGGQPSSDATRQPNSDREQRVRQCVAACDKRTRTCLRECGSNACEDRCRLTYESCLEECRTEARR